MALLRIVLLGGFAAQLDDGTDIDLPTRKSRLLLAYLAAAPERAVSRAHLAGLLWGDRAERQARGSLRQELHQLRRGLTALDPQPLRLVADQVALDAARLDVDVIEFQRLAGRDDHRSLQRAAALYRGELLGELQSAEREFQDWLALERQRLRGLAVTVLERLMALEESQAALAATVGAAHRLLALDPAHEAAHRAVMRTLAHQGRRHAALRQYHRCRQALADELGAAPEAATERLHELILAGAMPDTEPAAERPAAPAGTAATPALESGERSDDAVPTMAERRQLTVMLVDLVGSTALATRLDPEELHAVLGQYRRAVTTAILGYEGRIAPPAGDGLLAWFGWPRAHEDDAERAVRAGLAACEAVAGVNVSGLGALACRVGIVTGLVVIDGRPGPEPAISGEAPYLAARLQAAAEPGTVAIADATRRLLGRRFVLHDLGRLRLKGFALPIQAWRVLGADGDRDRFTALRGAPRGPMLGRRHELALLLDRWQQARDGEGQAILLTGEAGIGKSRLIWELRAAIAAMPHRVLRLQGSPHHRDSAFHPLAEMLRHEAGLRHDEPPEAGIGRLEAMLALPARRAWAAALLADLLDLAGAAARSGEPDPRRRKALAMQALLDHLAGLAARHPLLIVHDDLHWTDPSTLQLLDQLIERLPRLPLLLLLASRPEPPLPWTGRGQLTSLALGRLPRRHAAALIGAVAADRALPAPVIDDILVRADGVPLFLEELVRAVLAGGPMTGGQVAGEQAASGHDAAVPATLEGSLAARLDRLPAARPILQLAAVIGREFPSDVLAEASALPMGELRRGVEDLVGAGLVRRTGSTEHESLAFGHALLRDAAYGSLLREQRRGLHARVATALERTTPTVAPEVLAYHRAEAGLIEQAVTHWGQAGERSLRRYAGEEAAGHFRRALALLATLAETPARDAAELRLRMSLGVALIASKGYGVDEVRETYARARALSVRLGDVPSLFPVLFGLNLYYFVKPDLPLGRSLAARCLAIARRSRDEDLLVQACSLAGVGEVYRGRLVAARALLERGFAFHRAERHRAHALRFGHDALSSLAFLARTYALLGRVDLARQRAADLLAAIEAGAQPNSVAALHAHLAQLALVLGDGAAALRQAELLVDLATREELPLWHGLGHAYRGAALIEQAGARQDRAGMAEGVAAGLEGLRTYRATGAGLDTATCLIWFAVGHGRIGQPAAGLELLDQAARVVAETGESYFLAELHRVAAELRLMLPQPDAPAAEASLRLALEVARRQRARLFELRAATALARLWHARGAGGQARHLLAPLCTVAAGSVAGRDLTEARALLGRL
ncbi:MAG: AAA family ATPase [Geminicoccaceae bacterium]